MGSKEETERLKRKGLNLEQQQVKKQKSSEEAPEIETSTEEFTEEKIKEMMQLVPVEDVYVQALQVKHPIIDWKQLYKEDLNQLWALVKEYLSIRPATKWKLYDLSGVHHVTAKDKEIFMLVKKDYPLKRGLALVMISYKLQVENYSQMAEDLIRKIYNIANTLRFRTEGSFKASGSFGTGGSFVDRFTVGGSSDCWKEEIEENVRKLIEGEEGRVEWLRKESRTATPPELSSKINTVIDPQSIYLLTDPPKELPIESLTEPSNEPLTEPPTKPLADSVQLFSLPMNTFC
nr:hypothetical protein [Tanacetum cinerariifolium]